MKILITRKKNSNCRKEEIVAMTKWKDETILSLVFLLLLAENCLAGSDDDTQIPHETGNVPLSNCNCYFNTAISL